MRVKLCERCPYLPCDLAGHYDPEGVLHLCATCDDEREASARYYPRKAYRRQKCATIPKIVGTAQQSVARSATDSLALSGITPGEPPSVQRDALIASGRVETTTANGCHNFGPPPDNANGEAHAATRSSGCRIQEAVH
jgi:hypothetical protein